jgi:hypothetical protein
VFEVECMARYWCAELGVRPTRVYVKTRLRLEGTVKER